MAADGCLMAAWSLATLWGEDSGSIHAPFLLRSGEPQLPASAGLQTLHGRLRQQPCGIPESDSSSVISLARQPEKRCKINETGLAGCLLGIGPVLVNCVG